MTGNQTASASPVNPRRVVIAIPAYAHTCDAILGRKASATPASYIDALIRVDATPLVIPIVHDRGVLDHLLDLADGLMLIGGPDIDPACYGQTPLPGLRQVTPARDRMELMLARRAMKDQVPILGVCRGIQLLNVASGGSLWQDIAGQVPGAQKHDHYPDHPPTHLAHPVQLQPGSRMAGICGHTRLTVNSLHHQAIDRPGEGLSVVARSADGIIEAVEGQGKQWVVGVQWHPEWLVGARDDMLALFLAFKDACQALPHPLAVEADQPTARRP